MILIICIFLLILQIIFFTKFIKKSNRKDFIYLLSTIIFSFFVLGIDEILYMKLKIDESVWYFLFKASLISGARYSYILILMLAMIVFIIRKHKNRLIKEKIEKKKIFTYFFSVSIVILVLMTWEYTPFAIEKIEEEKGLKKAENEVINVLNSKFGYGNFQIEDTEVKNRISIGSSFKGYNFKIKSDYLKNTFDISLTRDNLEVYSNSFLKEYYREKLNIEDLDKYLIEYQEQKINNKLFSKFDAKIHFSNAFYNDNFDKDFGHIPSIDELSSKVVELHGPKIEINENIKSTSELFEYLKKLLKFYILELDNESIKYSPGDKYFRYKYDYTKIGITNYEDGFGGYGGYVFECRDDLYEEKNSKKVKILTPETVKVFDLDEILNNEEY